jgi:DNA-binding protein H-NS
MQTGMSTTMNVKSLNLKSMSFDRLSNLRDQVDAVLSVKVAEERRRVQDQLGRLDRLVIGGAHAKGTGRGGPRGAVAPKFRNPDNPDETWAGRGLKPRWLAAALKSGKKLEDFSIDAAKKKTRTAPKKTKSRGKAVG